MEAWCIGHREIEAARLLGMVAPHSFPHRGVAGALDRLGSVLTVDTIDHRLAAVARWIFSSFIGSASDLAADASAPVTNQRGLVEMVAKRREW